MQCFNLPPIVVFIIASSPLLSLSHAGVTGTPAGAETRGAPLPHAGPWAADAVGLSRQHFLVVPTAIITSESLDELRVAAELAARGHACSVLAVETIAPFYQKSLAGFYADALADHGRQASAPGSTAAGHATERSGETGDTQQQQQQQQQQQDQPCRFVTYPDSLPGGAQAALTAVMSGGKPGAGGGADSNTNASAGSGEGFLERHNPLRLLARMNAWLCESCGAMLLKTGALAALRAAGSGASPAAPGDGGVGRGAEAGGALPVSAVLVNFPDQCSCAVANLLGVPMLEANGNAWVQGPLSAPQFMSGLSPRQLRDSWAARARNAAQWALMHLLPYATPKRVWRRLRADLGLPPEDGAATPGGPSSCSPLKPVVRLLSPELEFPRPIPQSEVVVGAISPRPGGAISDREVAEFVEGAAGGLVLAGFGSTTVYGHALGARDFAELAAAFARLADVAVPGRGGGGVRVLWGVRDASLPEGVDLGALPIGANTLVVPWYPDNDVLAHPNTLAFVSHFGLHSLYGGAFHGVPMVGFPFTTEQLDNAIKGEAAGMVALCREAPVFAPRRVARCGAGQDPPGCVHVRAEGVVESVKEVLLNATYAAASRRVGALMQARYRVRPPLMRAADEVELALMAAGAAANGVAAAGNESQMPAAAGGHSEL